jgi:FkbM family methyltransferase
MGNNDSSIILNSLKSDKFKRRFTKAHNFETISGGGLLKHLERLLAAPEFYIPYILFAKAKLSRWHFTPVKFFWDRVVYIPMEDYNDLVLYMYGGLISYASEQKFSKFLIKNLNREDVFYDIGANRGFYTFLATDLCKETHSFEPMKKLAEVIEKNIRPDDHMTVNAVALSDKEGVADFYTTESSGTNTIDESVADLVSRMHHDVLKISVPTTTLDHYVENHTKPTMLKIDAEGAEERIIVGGQQFFTTNSPIIAMEIWGKENRWELSMSAASKLIEMGYKSYQLDNEGDMCEVSGDLSLLVLPEDGENFIFKK